MDSTENTITPPQGGILTLKKNFLAPDNLLEWYPLPFFPSTHSDMTLSFTTSREESFLFCTNGLLLRIPSLPGQAFEVKGRMTPYNVNFVLQKTEQGYHIKGIVLGETADYTIEKAANVFTIKGDTGKFRSNYTITSGDDEIKVEGDTGQFNSRIIIGKVEQGYRFSGFAEQDKLDLNYFGEEDSCTLKGTIGGYIYDLKVENENGAISVSGELRNMKTSFVFTEVPEGVTMEGMFRSDRCNYTITRDGKNFTVKGGFKGPVDYTIAAV